MYTVCTVYEVQLAQYTVCIIFTGYRLHKSFTLYILYALYTLYEGYQVHTVYALHSLTMYTQCTLSTLDTVHTLYTMYSHPAQVESTHLLVMSDAHATTGRLLWQRMQGYGGAQRPIHIGGSDDSQGAAEINEGSTHT